MVRFYRHINTKQACSGLCIHSTSKGKMLRLYRTNVLHFWGNVHIQTIVKLRKDFQRKQSHHIGRGPEGSTMHPPTSLQNYVFLNPQSVHNKKWDVNSKNIGTHYWFTALFKRNPKNANSKLPRGQNFALANMTLLQCCICSKWLKVKEMHICGLSPFFTAETVKMALGSHVIQKFHC